MKNKMLTSTPHCLPEIDAQKKKIADRLTVLAGTMLERDELIAKYVALIAEKHKGRHREDPPKGGHQPNNKFISEAARELKMLGRNEGGRCALIARALRVAGICREAKDAAIQAGLAYKHKALLEIADAPLDQQVAKVQEIANRKRAPRSKKAGMGTVTPAPTCGAADIGPIPAMPTGRSPAASPMAAPRSKPAISLPRSGAARNSSSPSRPGCGRRGPTPSSKPSSTKTPCGRRRAAAS